jgi:hypothetical protein
MIVPVCRASRGELDSEWSSRSEIRIPMDNLMIHGAPRLVLQPSSPSMGLRWLTQETMGFRYQKGCVVVLISK